jgi:hypothetical protein
MNIKSLIRTITPTLQIIAFALENLDTNSEGIDDKAAIEARATGNALQAYLDSFPATPETGTPAVVRGLEQTKAFCENTIASIDFAIQSDLPREAKETAVRGLVKSLSNDKIIYQAKKGQDAKILTIAIATANQKLNAFLGISL